MHIRMDVSLDPTLGCGQAHRWKKVGGSWIGPLGTSKVTLTQTEDGFDCEGCSESRILDYFRSEDDLNAIIREISKADPYVASLSKNCNGLRILRQDRWECLGTYILATNANVTRIACMVDSVCRFGKDLGGMHAFPSPKEILNHMDEIPACKLGFRDVRLIRLAEKAESGELDIDALSELDYRELRTELMKLDGVGPKVADCVALFSFGHLQAFPVDARISKCMEEIYGVTGSYDKVASYGMDLFGKYAGYAQELLYHRDHISC